jgi:alpha-tubulin suppressor-like RCC1 family protein
MRLLPISGAVQVSAGIEHSCAPLDAGTVQCWGSDASGQLGDSQTREEHVAVQVTGHLEHVVEITASELHTCALLDQTVALPRTLDNPRYVNQPAASRV